QTMSLSAETIAQTAKAAFEASQLISTTERTRALHEIRKELEASKDSILRANGEDMAVRCALSPLSHTYFKKKLEVVDRCSCAARRSGSCCGATRVSARETPRPSYRREMGYNAARCDGHCLASRSHGYRHLRARTTR
ncbi:hypothetical protein BGY98DRAFT_966678, partial [Russula aff. rugulosa BPL654]